MTANAVAQATVHLSRDEVEWVIEVLIDRLDALDGDADLEPEQDRCAAGDDYVMSDLLPRVIRHRQG